MIEFIEDQNEGYAPRTIINASADVTLAFAKDFTTAGEKLTKKTVQDQGKLYIPVKKIFLKDFENIRDIAFDVADKIEETFAFIKFPKISINIAGNGIYTMRGSLNQQEVDDYMLKFMECLKYYIENLLMNITLVRSGGQTGFDEAGIKASDKLNIKTLCLAPKGWKFRNAFGQDISDEQLFKARFNT